MAIVSGDRTPSCSLERLIAPISPASFAAEYWENKPLCISRGDAGYFLQLLSLDDMDRLLSTHPLRYPEVRLVRAGEPVATNQYSGADGRIDVADVWQHFADGTTIVVDQLERRLPSLAALCRALEIEFSVPFQANVYLTPPRAQGFKPHYDTHDVFILQVSGTKRWRFHNTPTPLPLRGQEFTSADVPLAEVSSETELHPGDTLYVPRGLVHEALSHDETSLHITLGVHSFTWADLLLEAVAAACLEDAAFRKSLPRGIAQPQFDREEARHTFRGLLAQLSASANFDKALDSLVDDFVLGRSPHLREQVLHSTAADRLTGDSIVDARPMTIHRLQENDVEIRIAYNGKHIRFPLHVREALLGALGASRLRVEALPGDLDLAGKLTLARRLIREGLLLVHKI